jgi:hypothetical protein
MITNTVNCATAEEIERREEEEAVETVGEIREKNASLGMAIVKNASLRMAIVKNASLRMAIVKNVSLRMAIEKNASRGMATVILRMAIVKNASLGMATVSLRMMIVKKSAILKMRNVIAKSLHRNLIHQVMDLNLLKMDLSLQKIIPPRMETNPQRRAQKHPKTDPSSRKHARGRRMVLSLLTSPRMGIAKSTSAPSCRKV